MLKIFKSINLLFFFFLFFGKNGQDSSRKHNLKPNSKGILNTLCIFFISNENFIKKSPSIQIVY
jgi:hypothetical protein